MLYCLLLAVLTVLILSSDTSAQPLIEDTARFGHAGSFNPFKMPDYFTWEPTSGRKTVGQIDHHPGKFEPHGSGKVLIFLELGALRLPNWHTDSAYEILKNLASGENNEVWMYSVKDLKYLDTYRTIPNLNIATEHGAVLRMAGSDVINNAVHPEVPQIKTAMAEIAKRYPIFNIHMLPGVNTVSFRYNKKYHDYFEPVVVADITKMLEQSHRDFTFRLDQIGYGEIKHKESDRGNLIHHLLVTKWYSRGIAIGRRDVDEGMFKAMNMANSFGANFHTVIVSESEEQETSAKYKLANTFQVLRLLSDYARRQDNFKYATQTGQIDPIKPPPDS
ncbi:hypothetical protein PtA15_7A248 [Puccinia triticina]|uniref:Uncharacterized protein n=1 Tax=Puccinia triticina TaxID=208348 RepID=A0ABY7CRC3_9BASI|nr:uncharacterized protein PtA15_7A248 [Puccinia triticina]WAQ86522.1 hypothetical protein PtA15_7A248 [Puccinia triticina]